MRLKRQTQIQSPQDSPCEKCNLLNLTATVTERNTEYKLVSPTPLMNTLFNSSLEYSPSPNQNQNSLRDGSQVGESGPSLPSAEGSTQSGAASDPTVILCALLIPLLVAFVGIIIVALLIRRMRRAESKRELAPADSEDPQPIYEIPLRPYYNPKQIFRIPIVLGFEKLDPSVLAEFENRLKNDLDSAKSEGLEEESVPIGFLSKIRNILSFSKKRDQKQCTGFDFNNIPPEMRKHLPKDFYFY